MIKIVYPIPMKGKIGLAPYIGAGWQYLKLGSNGSGNEWSDTGYSDGWTEDAYAIPICFGLDLDFGRIVMSVEYRYLSIYSGLTDYESDGRDAWFYNGQPGTSIILGAGFKF